MRHPTLTLSWMHDLPKLELVSTLLSNSGLLKLKKQHRHTIGLPVRIAMAFRAEPGQTLTHRKGAARGREMLFPFYFIHLCVLTIFNTRST